MAIEPILSIGASTSTAASRGTGLLQPPPVAPPPPKPKSGGRVMTIAGRKGTRSVVVTDEATGVYAALSEAVGDFDAGLDPSTGKRIDPVTGLPVDVAISKTVGPEGYITAPVLDPQVALARRKMLARKLSPGQRTNRIVGLKRRIGSLTQRKFKIGEQRMKLFREYKGLQMSVSTARSALYKAQVGHSTPAVLQMLGQRLQGLENSLNRVEQTLTLLNGEFGRVMMEIGGAQAELTTLMVMDGYGF